MQLELTGVDAREEILAQAGQRAERKCEERRGGRWLGMRIDNHHIL